MGAQCNNICLYLLDNRNTTHILKPTDRTLLCENFNCPYDNNFGRFHYEGDGKEIGICVSEGLIRALETDEIILRIVQGVINFKAKTLERLQPLLDFY